MIALQCDVLSCDKTTNEDRPSFGWVSIECVSHLAQWHVERRTMHACSPAHGVELLSELGEGIAGEDG